jgi:hypothetical protein
MSERVTLTFTSKEFREVMCGKKSWEDKATYLKDLVLCAVSARNGTKSLTSTTTTTTQTPQEAPFGVASAGGVSELLKALDWGDGILPSGITEDDLAAHLEGLYPEADLITLIRRAWLKWRERGGKAQQKSIATYIDNWIYNEGKRSREFKRGDGSPPKKEEPASDLMPTWGFEHE